MTRTLMFMWILYYIVCSQQFLQYAVNIYDKCTHFLKADKYIIPLLMFQYSVYVIGSK